MFFYCDAFADCALSYSIPCEIFDSYAFAYRIKPFITSPDGIFLMVPACLPPPAVTVASTEVGAAVGAASIAVREGRLQWTKDNKMGVLCYG